VLDLLEDKGPRRGRLFTMTRWIPFAALLTPWTRHNKSAARERILSCNSGGSTFPFRRLAARLANWPRSTFAAGTNQPHTAALGRLG